MPAETRGGKKSLAAGLAPAHIETPIVKAAATVPPRAEEAREATGDPPGIERPMEEPMSVPEPRRRHSQKRPAERTPLAFRVADIATEVLLWFTIVFGPWAFGTTENWAVWTMNVTGYALGALWLAKRGICWATGFRPARWDRPPREDGGESPSWWSRRLQEWPTTVLAGLTVALLGYCWLSAFNAAETFVFERHERLPHKYIEWLPHSFDSRSTWKSFFQYLGLACLFWSARDWLLVKTRKERHALFERRGEEPDREAEPAAPALPTKLVRLLCVLCANGALLGLQGILQRADKSNRLLWIRQPVWDNSWPDQFGAYAYRGNAAEYFNLVWPVSLGLWWLLHRRAQSVPNRAAKGAGGAHLLLLPCTAIMAACPLVAANRAGSALAVGGMGLAAAGLIWSEYRRRRRLPWAVLTLVGLFLGVAVFSDLSFLISRLGLLTSDNMGGRKDVYAGAEKMAEDFGWLGSGPGTFWALYPFYLPQVHTEWETQAHDDWLETRITFGYLGFALVLGVLVCVGYELFRGIAARDGPGIVPFVALALTMCLIHAKVDFPFQVDSLLRLFTLLCGIGMCARVMRLPDRSPASSSKRRRDG